MQQLITENQPEWHVTDSAFSNSYTVTTLNFAEPSDEQSEVAGELWCEDQIEYAREQFKERFEREGTLGRENVKMYSTVVFNTDDGDAFHANSGPATIINSLTDIDDMFDDMVSSISVHEMDYKTGQVSSVGQVKVYSNNYSPVRGGTFVELPEWISGKNNKDMCVLNVKNRDDKCFMWAILSVLHPAPHHRERVSHYKPFAEELNFTGISFPVSIDDIPRFEKQNPSIVISAYETLESDVRPWRVSKYAGSDEKIHIPLLLHNGHWTAITNWNRLCSTGHTISCPRCLCRFNDDYDITRHLKTCNGFASQAVKMPEKGSIYKYNIFKGANRLPVCIYSDFEALQPECESRSGSKSTVQKTAHHACSFNIFVVAPPELDIGPRSFLYAGKDAAIVWVDQMINLEKIIKDAIKKCDAPPLKSPENIVAFDEATECYLCGKSFDESPVKIAVEENISPNSSIVQWMKDNASSWRARPETIGRVITSIKLAPKITTWKDIKTSGKKSDPGLSILGVGPKVLQFLQRAPDSVWSGEYKSAVKKPKLDKVWEHCHITGTYRGAAHQYCNCQCRKDSAKIPVCFHNAMGYDSHFITKALAEIFERTDDIEKIREEEKELEKQLKTNPEVKNSLCELIKRRLILEEQKEASANLPCFTSNAPVHRTYSSLMHTSFKDNPVTTQSTLDGKIAQYQCAPVPKRKRDGKQLTLDGKVPPEVKRSRTIRHKSEQTFLKSVKPILDEPAIEKQKHKMRLTALSDTNQKFKTFSINSLTIMDTCAHLPSGLDTLLKNLPAEKKNNLRSLCKTEEQFALIQRKLLIPYEKMQSFEWFSELISTDKNDYYSGLYDKHATDEDMQTLMKVMKAFNLRTNREIHDLYLRVDVMGLADVFEAYRDLSIIGYGLDPAAFIGTPSFGFSAMLKMTGVQLELLDDVDMYTMLERGKHGGVSMAATRYAKANNPLVECYDPEKKESYIWFGDANNLYGDGMSRKLPYGNFRWGDVDTFDPHSDWSGSEGAFVEVDLEYPAHLHDLHSNLPLAPEHLAIKVGMLSDIQNKMCGGKLPSGNRKLTPHFLEHKNYVLHSENLKYYKEKGLILKKVHRVLYFSQSAWMKPWIAINTERRQEAKNDFEKDYYKLLNNVCFGRSMPDVRGRTNVFFSNSKSNYEKHTGRPSYQYTMDAGGENFRILFEKSTEVVLDQPIYAGVAILNLSKLVMYKFHYDVFQPKFGAEKVFLLMTDTDSLMYLVYTNSFYNKLRDISEHLDTSEYPVSHPLHNTVNHKVLGKFKDETTSVPISSAICLRAKLYHYTKSEYTTDASLNWYKEKGKWSCKSIESNHIEPFEIRKCKGVKKCAASKLTGVDYVSALHGEDKLVSFQSFRSYDHQVYTETIQKKALSGFDDKRFMCEDRVHTRPHGHYLNKIQ